MASVHLRSVSTYAQHIHTYVLLCDADGIPGAAATYSKALLAENTQLHAQCGQSIVCVVCW